MKKGRMMEGKLMDRRGRRERRLKRWKERERRDRRENRRREKRERGRGRGGTKMGGIEREGERGKKDGETN